jgi:hypothetical protein
MPIVNFIDTVLHIFMTIDKDSSIGGLRREGTPSTSCRYYPAATSILPRGFYGRIPAVLPRDTLYRYENTVFS